MFKNIDEFINWLWPKFEWTLLMVAITGMLLGGAYIAKMLMSPQSQGSQGRQYRYPGLPEACRCESCGYIVYNPGVHCPEIKCPKCGGRMWRVK